MKRILSGITPSSSSGLHLGNYLGMIKPAVAMQNKGECFYFIANLHSLNTVHSPIEVQSNMFNTYVQFLALGIDPEKTVFFVESDIPSIPYLQTILNNVVTVAELKRMHAYKDKLQENKSPDEIGMGLFSYPVLMAADILLFDTDIVPVGEDQQQHVEICRDIARSFNNRYGEVLKVPELSLQKETARVTGIDGARKMSKSLGNDLPIFADEAVIRERVMSITTDPNRIHKDDPGDPEKNVIFSYFKLMNFDTAQHEDMIERYRRGTIGDVEIKNIFLEFFFKAFEEARDRHNELVENEDDVYEIRVEAAARANDIADKKLIAIKKAIGI